MDGALIAHVMSRSNSPPALHVSVTRATGATHVSFVWLARQVNEMSSWKLRDTGHIPTSLSLSLSPTFLDFSFCSIFWPFVQFGIKSKTKHLSLTLFISPQNLKASSSALRLRQLWVDPSAKGFKAKKMRSFSFYERVSRAFHDHSSLSRLVVLFTVRCSV